MLSWIILLLILAFLAGILGFGGVLNTAVGLAQILFGVFLLLLLVTLVFSALRPRP